MSTESIIQRIARELAAGAPLECLTSALAPTDLQSLMLHVYRERSARRTAADVLAQYERSLLVQPASVDVRTLADVERVALECAEDFEAVDLSPVAPLATNRVLGGIDQNRCLATVRTSEVLADPTTAMALECARRRRTGFTANVRLCSRSRVLRIQRLPGPGYTYHFAIFSMVSAGRDRGSLAFELESLHQHVQVYVHCLLTLSRAGYRIARPECAISDTERDERRLQQARTHVLEPLSAAFPGVRFEIDKTREQGRRYYSGLCLSLYATDPGGERLNIGDGGFTDWTRNLLSNAKERLMVSALGTELLARRFARP